uniref:Tail tubular protein B n=1 Tax=uncultured marine virus TaxID=186617 RepID=A0A0F7L9S4_9VIRU|nr:tail tubular protein B [uncultured marine virus]
MVTASRVMVSLVKGSPLRTNCPRSANNNRFSWKATLLLRFVTLAVADVTSIGAVSNRVLTVVLKKLKSSPASESTTESS